MWWELNCSCASFRAATEDTVVYVPLLLPCLHKLTAVSLFMVVMVVMVVVVVGVTLFLCFLRMIAWPDWSGGCLLLVGLPFVVTFLVVFS